MEYSNNFLFVLSGKVLVYKGRGTTLGFPTANIEIGEQVPDGIYVGFVKVIRRDYPALIFVGAPVTFGETQRFAEAHLLDFSGNLYGLEICICFLKKLREVRRFENAEELVRQIKEDEKEGREYFSKLQRDVQRDN